MPSKIQNLIKQYPLPPNWKFPEVFTDSVKVLSNSIHSVGLSSVNQKKCTVTGSAATVSDTPHDRAYFELLERIAIMEAKSKFQYFPLFDITHRQIGTLSTNDIFPKSSSPNLYQFSLSNGVSLHTDWKKAFSGAMNELIERRQLLRSWFGEIIPKNEPLPKYCQSYLPKEYDFSLFSFNDGVDSIKVYGLFGFPKTKKNVRVIGFKAYPSRSRAVHGAIQECLQNYAFLRGEKHKGISFKPTALFHQDYYLTPRGIRKIKRWLAGDILGETKPSPENKYSFVDITPLNLKNKLIVVKAVGENQWPLIFGKYPLKGRRYPKDKLIHPFA